MNKRILYTVAALCLRLLLMIARKLDCQNDPKVSGRDFPKLEREVRETIADCEAIADGRMNP